MNRRALSALAAALIAWPTVGSAGKAMSNTPPAAPGGAPSVLVAFPNLPQGELGVQIAALFNLQVWRTLRQAPTPPGVSFGSATAIWSHPEDAPVSTARAADDIAERLAAQMVLWGVAHRYGDGVVVDMNLTIADEAVRRRRPSAAEWTIEIEGRRPSLMLPEGVYSFAPVVLSQQSVETYSSPSALQVCQVKTLPCKGPRVKGGMEAKLHDGPWSRVQLGRDGPLGWVYVPQLESRSDPAEFTSGMVYFYRGDFVRASESFAKVAASPASGELIRSEAAALHVAALARSGRGDVPVVLEHYRAQAIQPPKLHQAAVMYYLARWNAPAEPSREMAFTEAVRHFEAATPFLDQDDPWRKEVMRILPPAKAQAPSWLPLFTGAPASSP